MNALSEETPAQNTHKWRFHGEAKEYFGIWISNLFLSIITLGIYSAWAKVRRNRYLMGNMEIAGSVFQYNSTGMQIFIGRAIAAALIVICSFASMFVPELQIVFWLVFVALLPWLIGRAMSFRCRVVSWHNIHFHWHGDYTIVLKGLLPFILMFVFYFVLIGLFIFTVADHFPEGSQSFKIEEIEHMSIVVGGVFAFALFAFLLYPWAIKNAVQMLLNNIAWGSLRLKNLITFKACTTSLVLYLYVPIIVLFVIVGILFGIMTVISVNLFSDFRESVLGLIIPLSFFAISLFYFATTRACLGMMRGVFMNSTLFIDEKTDNGAMYFSANFSWWSIFRLEFSNVIAQILSLSLMTPWAIIRREKYFFKYSASTLTQDLETMVEKQQQNVSSFGSEYLDIDGVDLNL